MRLTYTYDLDTENKQRILKLVYEQLAEFVEARLAEYNPRRNRLPIPHHDEVRGGLPVRYRPRPHFLFGVKDTDKARLATISCLKFQRRRIPFKGVMVHPGFEGGGMKRYRNRITSASDKQFEATRGPSGVWASDPGGGRGEQFLVGRGSANVITPGTTTSTRLCSRAADILWTSCRDDRKCAYSQTFA